ncbi:sigma-70 family RNA polymerase sigma factor [uncultured Clostridium sp.]|uniref:sigma-70 family RNA polymerase sigma factor n=1 Tax=uncultured Clostridium sp. TaxID=59620 RepID=UPI0028EC90F6|nr:sigma-70 family RNA polymerase sigma factor [uncultured Clostridium sp.]
MRDVESLVDRAKKGDKSSLEELIKALTPLIMKESSKVYLKGYDREDLIQIGNLSLLKALDKYDTSKKNFIGYAAMAIKNNYYYLIRRECKENYEASLNKEIGEDIYIVDTLKSTENIEENFIKKEEYKKLYSALKKLSKEEIHIINWIYFERKKLTDYATENNLSYSKARYLKDKTINKLKGDMMDG